MLGGIGGRRRRGRQRMRWLDGITSWWWAGRPGMLQFMGLQRVGHNWATELNWTELSVYFIECHSYTWWQAKAFKTVSIQSKSYIINVSFFFQLSFREKDTFFHCLFSYKEPGSPFTHCSESGRCDIVKCFSTVKLMKDCTCPLSLVSTACLWKNQKISESTKRESALYKSNFLQLYEWGQL